MSLSRLTRLVLQISDQYVNITTIDI